MAQAQQIGRPDRDSKAAELSIAMAVLLPRDAVLCKAVSAITQHQDDGDDARRGYTQQVH